MRAYKRGIHNHGLANYPLLQCGAYLLEIIISAPRTTLG